MVELTRARIPTADILGRLKAPADGAVVVFEGIVRNHSAGPDTGRPHSGGRQTLYLEYEAYEPMAVSKMQEIAAEARRRFAIDQMALVHRLGRLEIGETSVLIVASAAHRAAAFDACRFAIDTLKRTVPLWKKEYFADGAVWAEGEMPARPVEVAPVHGEPVQGEPARQQS